MELKDYKASDQVLFRQSGGWQKGEVIKVGEKCLAIKWQQASNQKFTTIYDHRNVYINGNTAPGNERSADQAAPPLPKREGEQREIWQGL